LAQVPAFCPPAGARVDPPITVVDDLCNMPPTNSYRLQEQAAPLSFRQKAAYFAQNKIFSASAVFGAAFFGEIAQVRDDPPDWKKGAEGFGKRFGTRYAQSLTKSTAEFLLASWKTRALIRRRSSWFWKTVFGERTQLFTAIARRIRLEAAWAMLCWALSGHITIPATTTSLFRVLEALWPAAWWAAFGLPIRTTPGDKSAFARARLSEGMPLTPYSTSFSPTLRSFWPGSQVKARRPARTACK